MFGQLSNRENLRDLIIAVDAHHSKCYLLGMGKDLSKSSLARANQDRDYHIFEPYAYFLVGEAQQNEKQTSSNLEQTSMLSTQQRLSYVLLSFGGQKRWYQDAYIV